MPPARFIPRRSICRASPPLSCRAGAPASRSTSSFCSPFGGTQALGWEVLEAPGGAFVSKDGVTFGQASSMVFYPDKRVAITVFPNTFPDLRNSALSGGGVGAADIARHLLRPQIPTGMMVRFRARTSNRRHPSWESAGAAGSRGSPGDSQAFGMGGTRHHLVMPS